MEQKYGALRIVSTINKILGYATILFGVVAALITNQSVENLVIPLAIIFACLFVGLMFIASGQLFYVFMDIESNTRNPTK